MKNNQKVIDALERALAAIKAMSPEEVAALLENHKKSIEGGYSQYQFLESMILSNG